MKFIILAIVIIILFELREIKNAINVHDEIINDFKNGYDK